MARNIRKQALPISQIKLPYEFAFGVYSFSNYQYRLMLQLFIRAKEVMEGRATNLNKIKLSELSTIIEFDCVISDLMDDKDTNYTRCYEDIRAMMKKLIEYDIKNAAGEDVHLIKPCILNFEHGKRGSFKVWMPVELWNAAMENVKGYRIVDLKTLYKLRSFYSIRFYQFFAKQTMTRQFDISELRKMFELSDKYEGTSMFLKKVVDTAKAELDKRSPITFDYVPVYEESDGPGRPKMKAISCTPRYQPKLDKDGEILNRTFYNGRTFESIKTFDDFKKLAGIAGDQLEHTFKANDYDVDVDLSGKRIDYLSNFFNLWCWLRSNHDLEKYQSTRIAPLFAKWISESKAKRDSKSDQHAYVITCLKNEIKVMESLRTNIIDQRNGLIFNDNENK